VHTLLDYLQAFGLGLAVGVSPFLATLVAGALASANAGVNFDHTAFSFLESPWFLVAMAAALLLSFLGRRRVDTPSGQAAVSGIAIGLGALLGGGSLDDHLSVWWPGLIVGAAGAALSNAAVRDLLTRTARRLDAQARAALPVYAEGVGAILSALAILIPPIAIVAAAFFGWLLAGGRRREGRKYAGLRILR
jgi:FtsH-binding integral membrane protein